MELQRGFLIEAGGEMQVTDVVYPWRQRHVCAHLMVYPLYEAKPEPKELWIVSGLLMPFHTRRINRSTPIKSVTSSGDTFIKPIITKSFKTITEKVSIFANVKQLL